MNQGGYNVLHSREAVVLRSWVAVSILFSLAFTSPQVTPVTPAAPPAVIVLYNGALGVTPDAQGALFYLPQNSEDPPPASTQSWANNFTTLNTLTKTTDLAGYFTSTVTLDRQTGFAITFTTQVISETHLNNHSAGLSVIALSADLQGIELGFWQNRVWAQEGGVDPELFTQAEGATFDATAVTTYTLFVQGSHYWLNANSVMILNGPLRDYTAFNGFFDPYETPNFIFFGDDTSSASAEWRFGLATILAPLYQLHLPLVQK